MEWDDDKPVPYPFVGAIVLVQQNWYPNQLKPYVVEAVSDEDPWEIEVQPVGNLMCIPSLVEPFWRWPQTLPGYATSDDEFILPLWMWAPEQLAIFERIYGREAPKARLVKRSIKL